MTKLFIHLLSPIILVIWGSYDLSSVRADAFDTFGLGSRLKALGGAGTAVEGDIHAVYYNPAALAGLTEPGIGLEYFHASPDLDLDRTGGNDLLDYSVSVSRSDSARIADAEGLFDSARNLPDIKGFNFVFAGPLIRSLNFGLAVHIPGRTILKQKFGPIESPYFLDFSVPSRRFSFTVCLASRLNRYLSLGLGTSIIAGTTGEAFAHVPLDDPNREVRFANDYDFKTNAALTGGVLFRPTKKLAAGLAYRGRLSISMDSRQIMITNVDVGPFRLDMPLPVRLRAVTQFSPRRIALGLAFRPMSGLLFSGDITHVAWSEYRPPFPEIEIDFTEIDKIALPLEHPYIPPVPEPDFRDIIMPRIGIELGLGVRTSLRAGAYYRPSPSPAQSGLTNIAATDILGWSLGFGLNLNPFGIFPRPAEFSFHLLGINLIGVDGEKDETLFRDEKPKIEGVQSFNPGFPGFSCGGSVLSFGAGLVLPL